MKTRPIMRKLKQGAAVAGLTVAATALLACSPMRETIRTPNHAAVDQQTPSGVIELGETEVTRAPTKEQATVPRGNDHFEMNTAMRDLVESLSGTPEQQVQELHAMINSGAAGGLPAIDMSGQPPRTAQEAFASGGDCTDLANALVPMLEQIGITGGALIVHFSSAPEGVFHMVPYVNIGGRETLVDLQSSTFGATADGTYTVVHRLTYAQARYTYHVEQGDYHREAGRTQPAIDAYRRALQIYDNDAFVHHNLSVLLERSGDTTGGAAHSRRAAEIDPSRYGQAEARGTYNEEIRQAYEAYEQQRWTDCARHFRAALAAGEQIDPTERQTITDSIGVCERNSATTGGQK